MKNKVYDIITEKIIKKLESGVIPWAKPWGGSSALAYNRISKKPYSFLNQMCLNLSGEYATFKQWIDLGGKIKKGAKSEIVAFWTIYEKELEELDENGKNKIKKLPVLKYYNVFHISQVENVEPLEDENITNEFEPIEEAEKIALDYITRENIELKNIFNNKAFYNPNIDEVVLPLKEQFKDSELYYSTLFHELTHSTGAEKRLNRISKTASFGSVNYSKEELVAELGASYIMGVCGFETEKTFDNSASYIKSWLEVLNNDNSFIISAASQAEKAVNLILNK